MLTGQIMALTAALLSAVGTNLYNKMGERLTSDMIGYVRMFVALPLMIALALIMDKGLSLPDSWQSLAAILSSGIIGYFFCDLCMFKSIVDVGPRETSVVMTLNPVFTALLALLLFDETLEAHQVLGIGLIVVGIIVMILGESHQAVLKKGLAFAFAAAVLQSVADICAKYSLSDLPYASSNALRVTGGFAIWLVFGLVKRRRYSEQMPTFKDWRYIVMMVCAAALGPVFSMTLNMGALSMAPAGIVRSLAQTSPIFMIPIDIFIRKRKVTLVSLLGTLVSVAGVVLLF